jgi:hypothetical protein
VIIYIISTDEKQLYKVFKDFSNKLLTTTLKSGIINTTKRGDVIIEKFIIQELKIVIGLLLNGNTQQAIESIKDIIAYLEDYSNK